MKKHLLRLWKEVVLGWYYHVDTPCEVNFVFPLMGVLDWLTVERPDPLKRKKPVLAGAEQLELRWLMTVVSFSAATYSVVETAGNKSITVNLVSLPELFAALAA